LSGDDGKLKNRDSDSESDKRMAAKALYMGGY